MDKNNQLKNRPFSYIVLKDTSKVMIYRDQKMIKIVKGKIAFNFLQFAKSADRDSTQLKLAKITGHYKHGNEKENK